MLYLLISLAVASIFGMVVSGVYGTEALINHPWTDFISWSAIGAGVFMAAKQPLYCWYCHVSARCQAYQNDRQGCMSW